MMKDLEIGKLLALMVLLCGAASAYAAEPIITDEQEQAAWSAHTVWCSSGFDAPATFRPDNSGDGFGYVLKIGKKVERFDDSMGVGTGMNGRVLPTGEVLNDAEIVNAVDPANPEIIPIYIFRDRVFWPCDKNE